jgi:ketosteroid isomerase-like protein
MSNVIETCQRLLAAINAHDSEAIAALLCSDHRFVDSLGAVASGREVLREGWRAYFRMVPDYRIEVEHTLVEEPHVVFIGRARGTYTSDGALRAENAWTTPTALHAVVRDALVAEWHVYADNEPIRRCMARTQP